MNTNTLDSRARRPGPAVGVVVLLHLGLLLALLQTGVWPDRQAKEAPEPTWLRLLPLPMETGPASPSQARTPPTMAPALPRRPATTAATRPPVETTLFVVPETPPAPSVASPAAPAEPARPLNLSLPQSASAARRNPALDDPRSNTQPTTLERRVAEAMGSSEGPIVEERLPDGSLRLRRGASCIVVRPSRAAAIDPFNQSVSPKPQQVDSC